MNYEAWYSTEEEEEEEYTMVDFYKEAIIYHKEKVKIYQDKINDLKDERSQRANIPR